MSASAPLILITNCTASKRKCGAHELSCADFVGTPEEKFEKWWRASKSANITVPAIDLYQGPAWYWVRTAFSTLLGKSPATELWIVSAGLGLIPCDLQVPPYSATFAFGDPNSVARNVAGNREWWERLSTKKAEQGDCGSIKRLAERNPHSRFLIGLSAAYLKVVLPELVEAKMRLTDPGNLIVVCAGAGKVPELGDSVLPVDARFENKFGVTRMALNARMLAHIAETVPIDSIEAATIGSVLAAEATSLPPPRKSERVRLTDDAIHDFIRRNLETNRHASASQILKELRASGYACEQKRLSQLFKQKANKFQSENKTQ